MIAFVKRLWPFVVCVPLACGPGAAPEVDRTPSDTSGASTSPRPATRAPTEATAEPLDDRAIDAIADALYAEAQGRVTDGLVRAASHRAPAVRSAAARAFGRLDPDHPALATLLADDDATVVDAALFARLLSKKTLSGLRLETLLDVAPPQRRRAAALALRLRGNAEDRPWIDRLLADEDTSVQAAAALAVASHPTADQWIETLAALVETGKGEAQFAAAATLARMVERSRGRALDRSTRDALLIRLIGWNAHPNNNVRLQVARALDRPDTQNARDTLVRMTEDTDLRVRYAALRSYRFPGVPFESGAVARSIASDDVRRKWLAVRALEANGSPAAIELIVEMIVKHSDPWIRLEAIRAVNRADPGLAARIANGLTTEPVAAHRAAAAGALAAVRTPETAEYAARLWADSDPLVRGASVSPRLREGLVASSQALVEILGDPRPGIERALLRELETILNGISADDADRAVARETLDALWDREAERPTRELRLRILRILERLGDRRTDDDEARIERAASDSDARVRTAARRLGGPASDAEDPAFDLATCRKIAEWATRPRRLRATIQRPGFQPGSFDIELDVFNAPRSTWWFAERAAAGAFDGMAVDQLVSGDFLRFSPVELGSTPGYPPVPLGELSPTTFRTGTVALLGLGPDRADTRFFVSLAARPTDYGRYTPIGRVVKNFVGTTWRMLPGDVLVSMRPIEDG